MARPKILPMTVSAKIAPEKWTLLNQIANLYGVDLRESLEKDLQKSLDKIVNTRLKYLKAIQEIVVDEIEDAG